MESSQHLALLRCAGVVHTRRESEQIFYSVNQERLAEIQSFAGAILTGTPVHRGRCLPHGPGKNSPDSTCFPVIRVRSGSAPGSAYHLLKQPAASPLFNSPHHPHLLPQKESPCKHRGRKEIG